MMAEQGQDLSTQSMRASSVVNLLRTARVEERLLAHGRPVPLQFVEEDGSRQLLINGEMLARVDDSALASALSKPLADLLSMSPVAVGLVLQVADDQQVRGLATQLVSYRASTIRLTRIHALVDWRMDTFNSRLVHLVNGLGGRIRVPEESLPECVQTIAGCDTHWPQFSAVEDTDFMQKCIARARGELGHTHWRDLGPELVEMVWESLVISPRSALRQTAQSLRALSIGTGRTELLAKMAEALGGNSGPIDGALEAWPGFVELRDAWLGLWQEEDDALGARRRIHEVPRICVFEPPGSSMGFSEPENLPWDQPLLCWTMRERVALRDLVSGMEQSLARTRSQIRSGRLGDQAHRAGRPLTPEPNGGWLIQVPRLLPSIPESLHTFVDIAFAATRESYTTAFNRLDTASQQRAIGLCRGAYSGYLASTRAVWSRRLASTTHGTKTPPMIFRALITGIADALEWPIFIDVFESDLKSPSVAMMPAFTVVAVWTPDADFAPVWLPVETIGEALGQAPLRIRNVAVDADGSSRWLGDHSVDLAELRSLSTDGLLRSVHEGTLMMTIHKV